MVKFGKLPPASKPALAPLNPWQAVTVIVGGKETVGRPIEFDSEPIDQDGHNAFGVLIKPTKISTACPHCGAGLITDVIDSLVVSCNACGAGVVIPQAPLLDPFCNPIAEGRITELELLEIGAPVAAVKEVKLKRKPKGTPKDKVILDSALEMGPEPEDNQ